jgi:mannose-1-phosphate guanylyltransferase/mannose-1-phosphate guanylyltransferase/phosphomannomutase
VRVHRHVEQGSKPVKAFVLGAGLGTRLRPLTEHLPKPLVPVAGQPLITRAFDHLIAAGVGGFVVNTHHAAQAYTTLFANSRYRELPVALRHEPVILETAGGLANVRDLLDGDAPILVYNGDILTDIPLQDALTAHRNSGALVTLVLRAEGKLRNVNFDAQSATIRDIRGTLGHAGQACQFTGVYIIEPRFLDELEPGKVESVVAVFLRLIEAGAHIGGHLATSGYWLDLGDRDSYLEAHALLLGATPLIHPDAELHPDARVIGSSVVAAGCRVGAGAILQDTVLWDSAQIEAGTQLTRCVVRGGRTAAGRHHDTDF